MREPERVRIEKRRPWPGRGLGCAFLVILLLKVALYVGACWLGYTLAMRWW